MEIIFWFSNKYILCRSFFSSSFEPASYTLVGRLILNPNQPMILFNLLGLQRNLSKFEMNLPEIYLFGSPLLCLCVNFFLFCIVLKISANISLYLNWDTLVSLKYFSFVIVSNINALSITHVESWFNRLCLVSSRHGSMVPRWWISSNFTGSKRIRTFPKHDLCSE